MTTGRPQKYHDDTDVWLRPTGESRLQSVSDRRAIVDLIMENGGHMTFGDIDKHFGFPMREKVIALIRAGWLSTEAPQ